MMPKNDKEIRFYREPHPLWIYLLVAAEISVIIFGLAFITGVIT